MRFGICQSIEFIEKVQLCGFDYIESPVNQIYLLSNEKFKQIKRTVDDLFIKCEVFNHFFPANGFNIHLCGLAGIIDYIRLILDRIYQLGAKLAVIGSGESRRIPAGMDKKLYRKKFADTLNLIARVAEEYGIQIALEPLNSSETNIINNTNEAYNLLSEINNPNIGLALDFYHFRMENEPVTNIDKVSSYLKHIHFANSNGKVFPLDKSENNYQTFFDALKKNGYDGRISIEGKTVNIESDAPNALYLMKELT